MRRRDFIGLAALFAAAPALVENAFAARSFWAPEDGAGRVRVVINLSKQRIYVYRGGVLVGESTVSTGKSGYRTPRGTFRVLEKKVFHRSRKYDNAPMPYMQRITSYGVALHGGRVTGRPISHGCIRLPHGFARALYEATDIGTTVEIV
jgi:lipoprotein-anchoring transpeptidase ErfK/SrfK